MSGDAGSQGRPKPAGTYLGYAGDESIVASRQPFLDGARRLLARGYDPQESYNMRWANSATLSFVTTTIGQAAAFSVAKMGVECALERPDYFARRRARNDGGSRQSPFYMTSLLLESS
jgi:hypothetical protein